VLVQWYRIVHRCTVALLAPEIRSLALECLAWSQYRDCLRVKRQPRATIPKRRQNADMLASSLSSLARPLRYEDSTEQITIHLSCTFSHSLIRLAVDPLDERSSKRERRRERRSGTETTLNLDRRERTGVFAQDGECVESWDSRGDCESCRV
jgi:hypothetical protein